jgi:nucleoside-diphosphate-sugar epimerase
VPSIGIRPFIVYGPGRDNGLTASPTLAMAAAAAGEDYRMTFGGCTQLQSAPDTARVFIAAARAATEDARVFHLGGPVVSLAEVAAAIEAVVPGVSITVDEETLLPFPEEVVGGPLDAALGGIDWTPLADGVSATVERLRAARA